MLDLATLGLRIDARQVREGDRALDELGRTGRRVEGQVDRVNGAMKRMAQMAAAVASALAVVEAIKIADQMSLLDARLKLATKSMHEFAQASRDVYDIAQKNSVSLQSLTELYVKLSDPIRRVGGGINEIRGVVDAFSTAMRVGGASSEDAARAVLQFSQAMGQGKLSGDEFNSIAEASPRFLKAIAEGANLPIEQLKKLGAEGKLTADVVGNALLKSLDQLNKEAAAMPDTVGGAFTRLKNDIAVAIKDINKATSGTVGIAGMVDEVGKLIPMVKDELVRAFVAVDGWVTRNKEGLREAFDRTVVLVGQMWELAKAVGAVGGEVLETGNRFGVFKAALTGAALLVAGLQDGVKLIGASFVAVGGIMAERVLAPFADYLEKVARVAALFDDGIAGKINGIATGIRDTFKEMGDYVRSVEEDFASGNTEVNRLMRNLYGVESATHSAATQGERLAKTYKSLQTGGLTDAQKKAAEDAARALKKAGEEAAKYIEAQERELEAIGKTEAQQRHLNAARAAAAAPTAAMRRAIMSNADAIEAETAAWDASEKARKAAEDAISENAQSLLDLDQRIAGLKLEISLHGQTADAAIEAELAKVRAAAASLAISEEYRSQLQQQIDKLEEITKLQGDKRGLDKAKKAMDDAATAAERMADRMGDAITDSLMRGFESGKGFFSNMWSTIKNMIQTEALAPLVSGAVKSVIGASMGSLAGSASASTGSAAGGAAGSSIAGMLGGLFGAGGLGGSIMAGAGWMTGATTLGGSLAAAGSLAATGTLGGIASSLGMAVGALGPIALGIGAVATILKKGFGRGPREVTGTALDGRFDGGSFAGSMNESWKKEGGWFTSDKRGVDSKAVSPELMQAMNTTFEAITKSAGDFAKVLGVEAQGILSRTRTLTLAMTGDATKDQETIAAYFAALSDDIARELVPSLGDFSAQGETATQTLQRLVTGYALIDAALTSIGMAFNMVGVESLAARERLIAAAGGMESFAQNTAGFAQNFLTEEQRNATVLAAVRKELDAMGLAAVDTREEFANAVLSLNLANEAEAERFGKLIQMQEQFATAYPVIEKTTQAREMEAQIMRLQGDEAGALAIERAIELEGMDKSLIPLQERIWKLEDERDALEALKAAGDTARNDALSALQRAVDEEKRIKTAAHEQTMKAFDAAIKASQEKVSKLSNIAGILNGASDSVGIETDRATAQGQLQAMLATARAGGAGTLDADKLRSTLSVLGKQGDGYASARDEAFDRYQTAIAVGELSDITDAALSTEEKSLKQLERLREVAQQTHEAEMSRLDEIISTAQRQLDALNGINVSVLSVVDALNSFNALLAAGSYGNTGTQASNAAIVGAYGNSLGRAPDAAGMAFWQEKAAQGVSMDAINKAIATSTEAQDRLEKLYDSILGRDADAAGKHFWTERLAEGVSMAAIESAIRGSAENRGDTGEMTAAIESMGDRLEKGLSVIASYTQRGAQATEDANRLKNEEAAA